MNREPFKNVHVIQTETFTVTQCRDGFWLYDKTRGMNLSMRAKSVEEAFTETLLYYQHRLREVEQDHKVLRGRVESFVEQFVCDGEVEV